MFKLQRHAIANATDDVSVCENVVVVLVGIGDDSTASGVAGEDATACPQNSIVGEIGRACIGGCGSSDRSDDKNG
jgi:hypothetical protein